MLLFTISNDITEGSEQTVPILLSDLQSGWVGIVSGPPLL